MLVWLAIAAIVFYLPWIAMYRFMDLAGYTRKWRALVPGWNFLLMYDLARPGRDNSLWLLIGVLPAIAMLVTWVFIEVILIDWGVGEYDRIGVSDRIVLGAPTAEMGSEALFVFWAVVILPAFYLVPIVGASLAARTGRRKTLGMLATVPGVWVIGLPLLALTAKTNLGLAMEAAPLPPLPSYESLRVPELGGAQMAALRRRRNSS